MNAPPGPDDRTPSLPDGRALSPRWAKGGIQVGKRCVAGIGGHRSVRTPCLVPALVLWVASALASCAPGPDGSAFSEAGAGAPNTLSPAEIEAGWELLFDGETTAGWRGYNREAFPDTGWAVIDGALVVGATATDPDVAMGGDIVTNESFGDFDLRFEFKLSEVANSGVFYRVLERDGAAIWYNAPEYQVLHDSAYIDMGTMDMNTHLTGDNYDLHASGPKTLHGPGEWNSGRIRIVNGSVEHWLNGEKTVEYELGSPGWEELVAASKFAPYPEYGRAASGPIGLQDHGRNVWYRNLKVRRLEPVALFNGRDLEGWTVHGTELWYVEGSELVCESGPDEGYGYLATESTFRDFDLTLEFKQEADGNSGVFFRSSIEGTRVSGWQAEVAPPGLHTGGIYESYGRGWLVQPHPELDGALRMGEWNTMRVRAEGDRIRTWLNGVGMIDLSDEGVGDGTGSIALQIHDGGGIKVRWRSLRVVELAGEA